MANSGSFRTDYYGDACLEFAWEVLSQSTANNTTTIYWQLRGVKGSGGYYEAGDFYLNIEGNIYTSEDRIQLYDGTVIMDGQMTITHNADGKKNFGASCYGAIYYYDPNVDGSGSWSLPDIPRYATLTQSLNSKTLNSIKMNWSANATCNQVQYKIGNGNWVTASSSDAKSGTYTISNLSPNTTYSIKTRVRRKDSSLYTESSALSVTTYDRAKISTANNFNHGDSEVVGITNPGSISNLSLKMEIGGTQILTRSVSAGNNTIQFSDTELDNIYKKYGSSSSVTATFTVTGAGYTNSKTCTITLKGNQKTMKINISSSWKRGKLWINVNGTWKRAVIWINVNGTWKRGI